MEGVRRDVTLANLSLMNTEWHLRQLARRETPAFDPAGAAFDPYTSTSEWRMTIRNPEGETREVTAYTTSFTFRELKWLLEGSGFAVEAGYGCVAGSFSRKPLTVEDVEIMMVARRL